MSDKIVIVASDEITATAGDDEVLDNGVSAIVGDDDSREEEKQAKGAKRERGRESERERSL